MGERNPPRGWYTTPPSTTWAERRGRGLTEEQADGFRLALQVVREVLEFERRFAPRVSSAGYSSAAAERDGYERALVYADEDLDMVARQVRVARALPLEEETT